MSRWWLELVAAVSDVVPLPLLVLGLLLGSILIGALWYFWPAWVPRHLPRRQARAKRPVRATKDLPAVNAITEPAATDQLPDLPAAAFRSLADQLAAEGRYAEAVRERLRAIARDLIDRHVVDHRPGWTVVELANAAGAARPMVSAPIGEAGQIFSDIWYGLRPATRAHDERMRQLTADVPAILDAPAAATSTAPAGVASWSR